MLTPGPTCHQVPAGLCGRGGIGAGSGRVRKVSQEARRALALGLWGKGRARMGSAGPQETNRAAGPTRQPLGQELRTSAPPCPLGTCCGSKPLWLEEGGPCRGAWLSSRRSWRPHATPVSHCPALELWVRAFPKHPKGLQGLSHVHTQPLPRVSSLPSPESPWGAGGPWACLGSSLALSPA